MTLRERIENMFKRDYENRLRLPYRFRHKIGPKEYGEVYTEEEMLALSYKEFCEKHLNAWLKDCTFKWLKEEDIPLDTDKILRYDSFYHGEGAWVYRKPYIMKALKDYVKSLD